MLPSLGRATPSKSLKGQWGRWGALCLLVAVVVACGKDNELDRDVRITGEQGGSSSAGTGGRGDGGREGVDAEGEPRATRLDVNEQSLTVRFSGVAGAYSLTCTEGAPELREKDPPEDASQLPEVGTSYFLEGRFVANEKSDARCDVLRCVPYPTQVEFSKRGVLLTGTKPAPSGVGGAGGAGPGEEVATFEEYERQGPFVLSASYYLDAGCAEQRYDIEPVQLRVE